MEEHVAGPFDSESCHESCWRFCGWPYRLRRVDFLRTGFTWHLREKRWKHGVCFWEIPEKNKHTTGAGCIYYMYIHYVTLWRIYPCIIAKCVKTPVQHDEVPWRDVAHVWFLGCFQSYIHLMFCPSEICKINVVNEAMGILRFVLAMMLIFNNLLLFSSSCCSEHHFFFWNNAVFLNICHSQNHNFNNGQPVGCYHSI